LKYSGARSGWAISALIMCFILSFVLKRKKYSPRTQIKQSSIERLPITGRMEWYFDTAFAMVLSLLIIGPSLRVAVHSINNRFDLNNSRKNGKRTEMCFPFCGTLLKIRR
jgi:ABC-type Fe3+ transport system permease subunit